MSSESGRPTRRSNPLRRWLLALDPANVRERLADANDGILTIAGTSLGLAGAEIDARTSYTVLAIAGAVGTLSTFAVQTSQEWNDYEAEQDAIEHETRRLQIDPTGEVHELYDWFIEKGVSPGTAQQVAQELTDADALDVQLALEYGIEDPLTRRQVVTRSLAAAAAFLLGAVLPVLLPILAPFRLPT